MSSEKPPSLPGGGPPRKLSRQGSSSPRSMTTSSPKPSRLSFSVQRLPTSPVSAPTTTGSGGRALPPTPQGGGRTIGKDERNSSGRQKLTSSVSTTNVYNNNAPNTPTVGRPLATNQLQSRPPLPKSRQPTTAPQRGTRRSMTVSSSDVPTRPPPQQPNTIPRKKLGAGTNNGRGGLPRTPPRLNASSNSTTTTKKPPIPEKPLIPEKPSKNPIIPPKLPPKPAVLSKEEHTQVCDACKKFCNANKQLLAVSQSTLSKVRSAVDPVKEKFLNDQLALAADDLKAFNNKFSEFIRDAAKAYDHKQTNNVACLTVDIANFSSIICAALKVAAIDCEGDESVFKQCLKAITTVKDSLIQVVDVLKGLPDKINSSLVPQLEVHTKKTTTILAGLVGQKTTGPLISVGTCMEIEAATRAAVVSIAKLVNSFNGPLEQSIVSEAKVASCCVAQMWATINETINTNTNLLSTPDIREIIIGFAAEIKQVFAVFMEQTKAQVGNPSTNTFQVMKDSEKSIRSLFHKIISQIQAFSVIDTSSKAEIIIDTIKPTPEQIKVSDSIVCDPEDIVPPPPTNITQSTIDTPDDFVASTPLIWDEPKSEEGRILYTDTGNIRCATLNNLIIHTTTTLDMNRMKTFITTYRSFTTPEVLLEKIIQCYHVPSNANLEVLPVQLRCCNFLKSLIENHDDFSTEFIHTLEKFLGELQATNSYEKFATTFKTTLKKVSI